MAKQRKPDYSYWQNAQNEQIAFELKKQKLNDQDKKKATGQEQSKSHEINQQKKDDKKADAKTKKTIKLQKRNEIQQKRIEASHQPMNGMKLFNRWLRARRNPIYGILYLSTFLNFFQQRSWSSLAGFIALYICVIFPLVLTSDNHMGTLRNFEDDAMMGGSLFTLGIAGVIAQYATRDGSVPQQKSLSNPITFLTSLFNKERRAKSKQNSQEKKADYRRREHTRNLITGFILNKGQKTSTLTYSDLNHLCKTTMFKDHEEPEIKEFFREESGKEYGQTEINYFLRLIRLRIGFITRPSQILGVIAKDDWKNLKQAYFAIPQDVRPLIKEHQARLLKEELRRQELQDAIDREQLPELRIRQLGLPIPRNPQNAWDFENICRDWLEAWGDTNVQVTQRSGDGGIDVYSDHCVAQVKFYADQPVGRPELAQLKGASALYGDPEVVFFAYNGYTDHAIRYAEDVSMCLFDFHAHLGTFNSRNSHANELIKALAHSHLPK